MAQAVFTPKEGWKGPQPLRPLGTLFYDEDQLAVRVVKLYIAWILGVLCKATMGEPWSSFSTNRTIFRNLVTVLNVFRAMASKTFSGKLRVPPPYGFVMALFYHTEQWNKVYIHTVD